MNTQTLTIRLDSVHLEHIRTLANTEGRSLNSFIVRCLPGVKPAFKPDIQTTGMIPIEWEDAVLVGGPTSHPKPKPEPGISLSVRLAPNKSSRIYTVGSVEKVVPFRSDLQKESVIPARLRDEADALWDGAK